MKKLLPIILLLVVACNQTSTEKPAVKEVAFGIAPPVGKDQKLVTIPPSKVTTYVLITATATTTTTTAISTSVTTDSVPTVPVDTVKPPPVDTTTTTVRKNLVFEATFEGATFSGTNPVKVDIGQPFSNQQHCCTYSITKAPIARTGNTAVRYEVRQAEPKTSGSKRSELTGPGFGGNLEQWIGLSVYPPSNDGYSNLKQDQSVIQFHQNQDNGIPPAALWISSGNWLLQHTNTGSPGAPPATGKAGNAYEKIAPVLPDQWNDIVIHIKWSANTDGFVQVWLNGKLTTDVKNIITGYATGNYMKLGLYEWPWENATTGTLKQVIYCDDVRIGNNLATYKDVAP